MDKNFLFLSGVPRSGTTAFAEILNLHEHIAVGIERFKTLVMTSSTNSQFQPSLFEKDRFFDFRESDTNVRSDDIYRRMQLKYDKARWVGDKVPRYYSKFKAIYERFQDPFVFYTLRDVRSVALSWNARAANVEDRWPEANDYRKAVVEWNSANSIALQYAQSNRNNFYVISYEDLFPFGIDLIANILKKLDLDIDTRFLAQYRSYMTAERRAGAKKIEYPDQEAYIEANADFETYNKLIEYRLRSF